MIHRITIITPSFNQSQFLEQTIDSVLSQNYTNLEYIIIDGGSSDNSIDIIKKYEKYLTYWISEPDKGQSDAINKGLKIAKGDIVNWLNSDDYYEKDTFEIISERFQDPAVNVICGKSRLFNEKWTAGNSPGTDWYQGNLEKTIGWARIDQPETFFRKSAFDKIGYLNTSLHYLMDREWWVRYLLFFGLDGIVNTDETLVNFRLHGTSKTVSQKREFQHDHDAIFYSLALRSRFHEVTQLIQELFIVNHDYTFPDDKNLLRNNELIKKILHYYLLHRAHECYYQGEKKIAGILIKHIDASLLEKEEVKLLKRIRIRNDYLPAYFVRALRKYNSNG